MVYQNISTFCGCALKGLVTFCDMKNIRLWSNKYPQQTPSAPNTIEYVNKPQVKQLHIRSQLHWEL